MTLDSLINRAIPVQGSPHLAAYDPNHSIPTGYWICKVCKKHFYNPQTGHRQLCSIKVVKIGRHTDPLLFSSLIYVLGPNETGESSPFAGADKGTIEYIKKTAKKSYEKSLPILQRRKLSTESTLRFLEEYFIKNGQNAAFRSPAQRQEMKIRLEQFLNMPECKALKQACSIPIALLYICQAWENGGKDLADRITDPERLLVCFYKHITEVQCGNYLVENRNIPRGALNFNPQIIPEECEKELAFAEYCAFWTMQPETERSKLKNPIAYAKDSAKENVEDTQNKLGFISIQDNSFRFIHPLFQQYFTARYLISCLKKQLNLEQKNSPIHHWEHFLPLKEFIQQIKAKHEYEETGKIIKGFLKSFRDQKAWEYYQAC